MFFYPTLVNSSLFASIKQLMAYVGCWINGVCARGVGLMESVCEGVLD